MLDTISIWYLGIVASTAKAAMPVAPHLREMILSQSKLVGTVLFSCVHMYVQACMCVCICTVHAHYGVRIVISFIHRSALRSLHPLSLSPRSPAKPTFLSPFVIAEMDKFLTTIWCVCTHFICLFLCCFF